MTRLRSFRRATTLAGATLVLAALLSVLPVPAFDFVPVASAHVGELPVMNTVDEAALEEQQEATEEQLDPDRQSGGEEDVAPFALIAVTFAEEPVEPVLVRVRADDGTWDEWRHLEYEADEGPDVDSGESTSRAGTEPFWVGSADGYELSLGDADADHATVVTVRETERRVLAESTPMAGAATMDALQLRSSWNARPSTSIAYASNPARLAVVHHSVSSNNYTRAQVPAQLRSIQAYHQQGRGWADIGYNFVVDKYGGIWEGRQGGADRPVVGAHAAGLNTGSFGVMMLGDYGRLQPTAAGLEGMARIVGWKHGLAGTNSRGTISFTPGTGSSKLRPGVPVTLNAVVGHQDVGYTACPGTIQRHLGSIRTRAVDWARWYVAPVATVGAVRSIKVGPGWVSAEGWAVDPYRAGNIGVRLSVGGRFADVTTSIPRPDIAAQYPGSPTAGFSAVLTNAPPGPQTVCVTAMSSRGGIYNRSFCYNVTIPK